jgi:hypothetical protein
MLERLLMPSVEMLWNTGFSGRPPGTYADPLMLEMLFSASVEIEEKDGLGFEDPPPITLTGVVRFK